MFHDCTVYVGGILEAIPGTLIVGLRSPLLCGWKSCLVKTASVIFFHCELNSMFGDSNGNLFILRS